MLVVTEAGLLGRAGLSNLWQMAGHNYFFLTLAGQYTNNVLLGAGVRGGFTPFHRRRGLPEFFWIWNGKWRILVHSECYFAHCSNLKLYLLKCFILVFSPPHYGSDLGRDCALLSRKFFWYLSRKWCVLVHSWCNFYVKLFLVIKHKFTSKVTYRKISSHFSGKR